MMADTKSGDDENDHDNREDIRARFAHVEETTDTGTHTELPPVPTVNYQRPKTQAEREAEAGKTARVFGGGGLVGNSNDVKGSGIALTIGTNLVASIIVGTGLGWAADKYLLHSTTTPWGLIVGFLLGVTAGFVGLVRAANRLNKD